MNFRISEVALKSEKKQTKFELWNFHIIPVSYIEVEKKWQDTYL